MSTLGPTNPTLLVVLPNLETGESDFKDFSSQWIIKKFAEVGLYNYALTYLVKCKLPEDKKPSKRQADACVQHIADYLDKNDVKILVPVGSLAVQVLMPGHKVSDVMGDIFNSEGGDLFPLMSPSAVKHDARKEIQVELQVRALQSCVSNVQMKRAAVNYRLSLCLPLSYYNNQEETATDIETTGLDPHVNHIRCTSFTNKIGESVCVEHPNTKSSGIPRKYWMSTPLIAHNAKFEYKMISEWWGFEPNIVHDTQMQHFLLHEEEQHHLDILSRLYTSIGGFKDESVDWLRKHDNDWTTMPMEILSKRNCGDTDATLRIHKVLYKQLEEQGLSWLYHNVAVPVQRVTARLENRGLFVNVRTLNALKQAETENADKLTMVIKERYNLEELNFRSPKQMSNLIFNIMGVESVKDTKSRAPSTDGDALDLMASRTEGDAKDTLLGILKIRSHLYNVSKADEILDNLRANETVACDLQYAVTFRYRSSNPNLQNMPTDGVLKKAIESKWDGGKIIEADYSQLELRLIGGASGCRELINCYNTGVNVHTRTAEKFSVERNDAKRINFAVAYGVGAKKLMQELKCSYKEAREFLTYQGKEWWEIAQWRKKMIDFAAKNGYVTNLMGMRRRLPNITSSDTSRRIDAELQAGNFPIQSLGACTCMYAMVGLEDYMHPRDSMGVVGSKFQSEIILQIHDSILIDYCPRDDMDELMRQVQYFMVDHPSKVVDYKIKLEIEAKIKDTWGGNYGGES